MEYDFIIKTAYGENPFPETPAKKRGRKKKSKVLNLICRLYNYKESVCLFIKNLCVPFDNNQAERDLRMVKVKTKVSGCFRNEEGEYSCAMKSHFRKFGNQMSGSGNHLCNYASLLA